MDPSSSTAFTGSSEFLPFVVGLFGLGTCYFLTPRLLSSRADDDGIRMKSNE